MIGPNDRRGLVTVSNSLVWIDEFDGERSVFLDFFNSFHLRCRQYRYEPVGILLRHFLGNNFRLGHETPYLPRLPRETWNRTAGSGDNPRAQLCCSWPRISQQGG